MRIYVGAFLTEKVPGENDHDLWRSQLSLKKKNNNTKKNWASGLQSGLFSSYSDSFTQTLSLFNQPFVNVTSL